MQAFVIATFRPHCVAAAHERGHAGKLISGNGRALSNNVAEPCFSHEGQACRSHGKCATCVDGHDQVVPASSQTAKQNKTHERSASQRNTGSVADGSAINGALLHKAVYHTCPSESGGTAGVEHGAVPTQHSDEHTIW